MYQIIRWLSALVTKLKPETLKRLAAVTAFLAFDILRVRRKLVLANLDTAFGASLDQKAKIRMARSSYRHFALTVLEVLASDGPEIAEFCEIHGAEHLSGALAEGKGAFILCGHLGNWECLAATLNRNFAPVHVVVKKVGGDGTNRFVDERRARMGLHSIPRNSNMAAVRTMVTQLQQNKLVGFVVDQRRPGEPRLDFFGKPAKTNTGLATMWRRTQAPVVPAFIRRVDVNRHVVTILPQVQFERSANRENDVLAASARINKVMEEMIRQAPEQYFWLHDRWK